MMSNRSLGDRVTDDVVNDGRLFVHQDEVATDDYAAVASRQPVQLPLKLKWQRLDFPLQARRKSAALAQGKTL